MRRRPLDDMRTLEATSRTGRPRSGFTMVETLIVLVLMGVLLAIAVPRTAQARRQLTIDAAVHQLHNDLSHARVEAVKRNTQVRVAKTSSTTYSVSIASPLTIIKTGRLPEGVQFGLTSPDTVKFAAFGPSPTGAKSYLVMYNGSSKTVRVGASGMVMSQ